MIKSVQGMHLFVLASMNTDAPTHKARVSASVICILSSGELSNDELCMCMTGLCAEDFYILQ